ncbi:TPA: ead/Ea22-like family protein [Escherichia coli]|nr:ead/Ea22-like family protein [Escherichia coli]
MTALNKQALRKLAKALSGKEWVAFVHKKSGTYAVGSLGHERGEDIIKWAGLDGQDNAENKAKFIAAANPATVLALLDELEAKDSTISTQQQEIRTLLNALEQATEKRNSDIHGQKRLIGWRASDYTDETSDPELAKNWAAAIGVLPIFEGDVNTKLTAASIGVKGE